MHEWVLSRVEHSAGQAAPPSILLIHRSFEHVITIIARIAGTGKKEVMAAGTYAGRDRFDYSIGATRFTLIRADD